MEFKQLTVDECSKMPKSYLEKSLENGTAEYYAVKYEGKPHNFFFYKHDCIADICVEEKSQDSLFDQEAAMNEIFCYLKERGFKIIRMTLLNDKFIERNDLAIKYGFKETGREEIDGRNFIHYQKELIK